MRTEDEVKHAKKKGYVVIDQVIIDQVIHIVLVNGRYEGQPILFVNSHIV